MSMSNSLKSAISRRGFVAASAATAAISTLVSTALADVPEETKDSPVEPYDQIDCDICVVGAGISGLAAAVQASENGTKVLLIEKAGFVGGNGMGTEGIFAIDSHYQIEQGIEIAPADILSKELEEAQFRADGSMWYDMVSHSAANIDWLEENGVLFSGIVDNYHTGLYQTMHWWEGSAGAIGYVPPMQAAAEKNGCEIRTDTRGIEIVLEDGKVAGLLAEDSNGIVRINAKAVILATGGIGHNEKLLAQKGWTRQHLDEMIVQGMPAVEGDGYTMAIAAGGRSELGHTCDQTFLAVKAFGVDMTPPYDSPLNGGFGIAAAGNLIWINQDADRFTNEGIAYVNMAATGPACIGNRESYIVFDQSVLDSYKTNDDDIAAIESALSGEFSDCIATADSIEGLATAFNLDAETLTTTIARYNELCATGIDTDFGKMPQLMVPIANPPFYIAKLVMLLVAVDGGIKTNKYAQVLDKDLYPIPGLYAVGLDGAMLWRDVYTQNMAGTAMANNVNSGRNAANHACTLL
ncbi:MAG: FAD-dependent oxidoreductase [Coriobacteriales bacterium]|nr:FAD-dependent oxidoreductase [Coriobacteriales bacterium]